MKLQFLLILLTLTLFGCQQKKSIDQQMEAKTTVCYQAIDGTDTIWMQIDTSNKIRLLGLIEMNYTKQKRRMNGQFEGKLKGDTITGHYDFKVNKVDKWYRNPVAFLKRDGQLKMGVGEIVMKWGSPFFDEREPIDYEKGRFVFAEANCK